MCRQQQQRRREWGRRGIAHLQGLRAKPHTDKKLHTNPHTREITHTRPPRYSIRDTVAIKDWRNVDSVSDVNHDARRHIVGVKGENVLVSYN